MVGRPFTPKGEQQKLVDAVLEGEQRALELEREAAEIRRVTLTAAIEGDVSVKWLADKLGQTRKTVYRHAGHDM